MKRAFFRLNTNAFKSILLIIFMFMFLFDFRILQPLGVPRIFSSVIVLGCILVMLLFMNKQYFYFVNYYILKRKVQGLIAILLGIIFWGILVTVFYGVFDFAFVRTLVHQGINMGVCILLFAYFDYKGESNKIMKYIFYAMLLQASIQLLSLLNQNINDFLNIFRSEYAVIINTHTAVRSIRGTALVGSEFFSLAAQYAFFWILCASRWEELPLKNKPILNIISFIIILYGSIAAGRSALFGVLVALILLIVKLRHKKMKLHITGKKLAVFVCFIIMIISLVFSYDKFFVALGIEDDMENMAKYLSEFLEVFDSDSQIHAVYTSNDFIMDDMNSMTLLVGDGKYSGEGKDINYMGTDSGYLRQIYYFGMTGFIFLLLYDMYLLDWKKRKIESFAILILMLIMNYKGEVIGDSVLLHNLLIMIFIGGLNGRKRNAKGRI